MDSKSSKNSAGYTKRRLILKYANPRGGIKGSCEAGSNPHAMFSPNKKKESIRSTHHITHIFQSEITFATHKIQRIATIGAGPCVIFIVNDKVGSGGFMTHLYSYAEIATFTASGEWLLNQCKKRYSENEIDIYLIGGYSGCSTALICAIDGFIFELNKSIAINSVYKNLRENWSSSVVFNFSSGEIFLYDFSKYSSPQQRLFPSYAHSALIGYRNLIPCLAHLSEYPSTESEVGTSSPYYS